MSFSADTLTLAPADLAAAFFEATAGDWHSQRRYYTLKSGATQEVVSQLSITLLTAGCPELRHLAELHQLTDLNAISCGAQATWESDYVGSGKRPVVGSTIFGVQGNLLLRDRGFATSRPVTARYHCAHAHTMRLKMEYNGSAFEEEIQLIGHQYRTRQTVISRAGEEVMIGQYLETRC